MQSIDRALLCAAQVLEKKAFNVRVLDVRQLRITSYNVCYTKLLRVLMVGGAEVKIGTPLLPGAKVKARIVEQDKDKKILVFKSKRRKFQRKLYGHRQPITRLQITAIEA